MRRILPALLLAAMALAGVLLPEPRTAEATTLNATALRISTDPPGGEGVYVTGDRISFEVTFDRTVKQWNSRYNNFWGANPLTSATRFQFQIGSANRYAYAEDYGSGNNDTTILFHYDVVAADEDTDGISVPATSQIENSITHVDAGNIDHVGSLNRALPDNLAAAQSGHEVNNLVDYDSDGDGLIEVATLAQLDAIRYDLDGDHDAGSNAAAYRAAFPKRSADNGCPDNADGNSDADDYDCAGYELDADLDFAGSSYVGGAGWAPIGAGQSTPFTAIFDGNGHTIRNLTINISNVEDVGLFGWVAGGAIRSVGLVDAEVRASYDRAAQTNPRVGTLAGVYRDTAVRYSYATGSVRLSISGSDTNAYAGGLLGATNQGGTVAASWADVEVSVSSSSTRSSDDDIGGLVGLAGGTGNTVTACYATGSVTGSRRDSTIGGLIGSNNAAITASYVTGRASSPAAGATTRGLVGSQGSSGSVTASYWDTDTTGHPAVFGTSEGVGEATADLQRPGGYTGIYAAWNVDADGDATTGDASGYDDPWHFGESDQYPILKFGHNAASIGHQRGVENVDYDRNGNGLIEVSRLAQLNAIRRDLDGDGAVSDGDAVDYALAFPGARSGMGCPGSGCEGYELAADLDFDGSAYAGGAGWVPIGTASAPYTATFRGNGRTIANLFINSIGVPQAGLFGQVSGGTIEGVGLTDVNITAQRSAVTTGDIFAVGALAGAVSDTTVRYSYATGAVKPGDSLRTGTRAGGLIGRALGSSAVWSSWSTAAVTIASTPLGPDRVGGLVGELTGDSASSRARLTSSYAAGAVTAQHDTVVGGLVGISANATVTDSYASGRLMGGNRGGLIGNPNGAQTAVTASYWDAESTTIADDNDGDAPEGKTTTDLITPTGYAGIYAGWNRNVDGRGGNDDPWDFGVSAAGSGGQYPILKFGHSAGGIALQRAAAIRRDYDADDNGLIEISNLAQLNAMRWDLDGDGDNPTSADDYNAAFANRLPASGAYGVSGCPLADGCAGYELAADLDFDENGDGAITEAGDPAYWNGGAGWERIGTCCAGAYNAIFDGNGHTIANLYINRPSAPADYGLFGGTGADSHITRVGLPNANVTGQDYVGALAGDTRGRVSFSWATGQVSGDDYIGLLVGINHGPVYASWSSGQVTGDAFVGGLVGTNGGHIIAAYSHANVTVNTRIGGGLTGQIQNITGVSADTSTRIDASYSTGVVSGSGNRKGGAIGQPDTGSSSRLTATNTYWDATSSGISAADLDSRSVMAGVTAKTTFELQAPTEYGDTGIYAGWNVDVDGQAGADDPWDFGTFCDYPALQYGGHLVSRQRPAADDDFPNNDVTFYSGQTVTLTAGNRGGTAYLWEQILDGTAHTVTLSGAETAQATFMAPAGLDDAVALNFKLTLLADGVCRTDLVKVTILPAQPNELSSLTVTAGGTTRPLTPAFASSGRSFDTYVGAYTGRAEIAMAPADEEATVSFNGDDPVAGSRTETVSLAEGHNRFTITVTPPEPEAPAEGEDDAAAEPLEPVTYHLNIRRQRTPKLAFNPPHYLLMNEGETATYTVELDTRWLGAEVIINISSDNPDITVSPDTVSISQYDWSERTIEVTAAKDADGEDDYATIRHIANGGHYNNVGGRLRVEVSDNDTVAPTPTPGPTPTPTPAPTPTPTPVPGLPTVANTFTTTVLVDGQTVTITREAGSLTGVTLAYPATLTRNLQVTIAPLLDGIPLASERFGLGTTGATLTVVGVPAGGLEICLPLSNALVAEAGTRPLTLVRYGGTGWQGLPGAERRGMSVCAGRVSTGLFAAAYVLPQLGPASDLTVAAGDAAGTLTLRWTPGANATRHWVAGIKQSDWDAGDFSGIIWTAADGRDTHTVSGLDSGAEYVFAVAAGRGAEWSGWTALVRGTPN